MQAAPLHAGFVFTRIADTTTPIPGGSGNFLGFLYVTVSGDQVMFVGGRFSNEGIYMGNGGALSAIVSTNTIFPGTTNYFDNFQGLATDSGHLAFYGHTPHPLTSGIFKWDGSLHLVADTTDAVPDSGGQFNTFDFPPDLSGGTVALEGWGVFPSSRGIYLVNGSLTTLVNTNTSVPGGTGHFTDFGHHAISGNTLVFSAVGSGGQSGVYLCSSGCTVIADQSTARPNGPGNFASLFDARPAIDGSAIAFALATQGVYKVIGGGVSRVADPTTVVPGETNVFYSFGNANVAGSTVVFGGSKQFGGGGIYMERDGVLSKVIANSDSIEGNTISIASFGRFAADTFNGHLTVAFVASLPGGSQAVYRADELIPALSQITVLDQDVGLGATDLLPASTCDVEVSSSVLLPNWQIILTCPCGDSNALPPIIISNDWENAFFRIVNYP